MAVIEIHLRRERSPDLSPRISSAQPRQDDAEDRQKGIVLMLISQAQVQLAATLSDAADQDTKALGLLALEAAGVALLVGVHLLLNRFWPALLAGSLVSTILFAATLSTGPLELGPSLDDFYEDVIDRSSLGAAVAMLAALNHAVGANAALIARKKRRWLLGVALTIATALGGAVYLPLVG